MRVVAAGTKVGPALEGPGSVRAGQAGSVTDVLLRFVVDAGSEPCLTCANFFATATGREKCCYHYYVEGNTEAEGGQESAGQVEGIQT